jgi:hypothetical protein
MANGVGYEMKNCRGKNWPHDGEDAHPMGSGRKHHPLQQRLHTCQKKDTNESREKNEEAAVRDVQRRHGGAKVRRHGQTLVRNLVGRPSKVTLE